MYGSKEETMTDKLDEAYRRHVAAMEEVRRQMEQSNGYRKRDLMRQLTRMNKERCAYLRLRKGGSKCE